jgi:hypothetical protein
LTRFEYNNTVRDLLGDTSSPAAALPAEEAGNGFGNDATAQSVSTLLAEKYAAVAEGIAQRVTGTAAAMTRLVPCAATDGLDMKCAAGEQHQSGIIAFLTGTTQRRNTPGFGGGPSIDQMLATRISKGKKPRASLQLAIRWATGKSFGKLHPINCLNFEDTPAHSPIPPRVDPRQVFSDLFGKPITATTSPSGTPVVDDRLTRKKSILDYVGGRYATLAARLGAGDRQKLEQHLTKIREIEQDLTQTVVTPAPSAKCAQPSNVDTAGYIPAGGGLETDALIPKVGRFMTDMLVMALACDLTAVGTLQWSDTEAKHTFPWLGLKGHHHAYQHDGGFRPDECAMFGTWYSEQHAYLIESMAAVDMGGHSLLDESVVFFGSELQAPLDHAKNDMPFLLAGGGGGLKTGRWLRYGGRSHNDLLVAILNLFGDPRPMIGAEKHNTGALTNLV